MLASANAVDSSCHITTTNAAEPPSDNSLQLPRIAQGILNRDLTRLLDPLLSSRAVNRLFGEVNPSIPHDPIPELRELDHGAFAVEEQEVLRAAYWERRVGFFAAGRDLGADLG